MSGRTTRECDNATEPYAGLHAQPVEAPAATAGDIRHRAATPADECGAARQYRYLKRERRQIGPTGASWLKDVFLWEYSAI
jgi:hypothetical protein